jgi:hypothetical protein
MTDAPDPSPSTYAFPPGGLPDQALDPPPAAPASPRPTPSSRPPCSATSSRATSQAGRGRAPGSSRGRCRASPRPSRSMPWRCSPAAAATRPSLSPAQRRPLRRGRDGRPGPGQPRPRARARKLRLSTPCHGLEPAGPPRSCRSTGSGAATSPRAACRCRRAS